MSPSAVATEYAGPTTSSSSPRTLAHSTSAADSDDSDIEAIPSLQETHGAIELQKLRSSSQRQLAASSLRAEEVSSSDDESEKLRVRPVTRVGSRSKEYTDEEEKTVLRKLDRNLVIFMALLYMLSFLDRSSEALLEVLLIFHSAAHLHPPPRSSPCDMMC